MIDCQAIPRYRAALMDPSVSWFFILMQDRFWDSWCSFSSGTPTFSHDSHVHSLYLCDSSSPAQLISYIFIFVMHLLCDDKHLFTTAWLQMLLIKTDKQVREDNFVPLLPSSQQALSPNSVNFSHHSQASSSSIYWLHYSPSTTLAHFNSLCSALHFCLIRSLSTSPPILSQARSVSPAG